MVGVGLNGKHRSETVEGGSGYKGEWSVDLVVEGEGMVRGWGDKNSSNRWWRWGWWRPP